MRGHIHDDGETFLHIPSLYHPVEGPQLRQVLRKLELETYFSGRSLVELLMGSSLSLSRTQALGLARKMQCCGLLKPQSGDSLLDDSTSLYHLVAL